MIFIEKNPKTLTQLAHLFLHFFIIFVQVHHNFCIIILYNKVFSTNFLLIILSLTSLTEKHSLYEIIFNHSIQLHTYLKK